MPQGTIFVSHRAEYGNLVQAVRTVIESTSRKKIRVFISEDLRGAEDWRKAIKAKLAEAQHLFLIYGAPHEDWSWCFYEAGYFAGVDSGRETPRRIFCISRPDVPPPGPLDNLQMVTNVDRLTQGLMDIYDDNGVDYNHVELRQRVDQVGGRLFCRLDEFVSYQRISFVLKEGDISESGEIPHGAVLKGDKGYLNQLFGIGREEIPWEDITRATSDVERTPQEQQLYCKWVAETKRIIVDARRNRFRAPQTVLLARAGLRVRFLPHQARIQGDGAYCCDFLVIDEVGGPTLGLTRPLAALLTFLRLAVRFRHELIRKFECEPEKLPEADRRARIDEIPRIIDSLLSESENRGNMSIDDLQGAFDDDKECDRIAKLVSHWPFLKEQLYAGLGLSVDGGVVSDQGLTGANRTRYRLAFDSLRLLNLEFLSLCAARVSQKMTRSQEDLTNNAEALETNIKALYELPPIA